MEVENVSSSTVTGTHKKEVGVEDDVPLPGFRFHPTDEELVGFYLRRKVEKRPIKLELIKQADIYKYDPWDLPKSSPVGEKEWYFFCKRGRKYRNSIRPNRVTGSGFWKATGIDRPIYSPSSSSGLEGRDHCIGLKKSLVYYRGSAGKGTKTDWMMHEFRLPGSQDNSSTKPMDAKSIAQEAEVWTLCRIFKRNISYKRCIPDWRELAAKKTSINSSAVDASSKTCSTDSSDHRKMAGQSGYNISFDAPLFRQQHETKPYISSAHFGTAASNQQCAPGLLISPSSVISQPPSSLFSSTVCGDINELLRHADWEDLRSMADSATASTAYNPFYS